MAFETELAVRQDMGRNVAISGIGDKVNMILASGRHSLTSDLTAARLL
jgi:hypothetical protein